MSTLVGPWLARYIDLLGQPRVYLGLLLVAVASQLPYVLPSSVVHMLILTFIIGIAAIAWNIIGGYAGQFSLGNGAFFGVAAYTAAILAVRYQQSFVLAAGVGIALTVVVAVVIGYPTFKLTGHYFALATITIVEGLRFLTRYFRDFTGGAIGMSVVPATLRDDPALNLTKVEYYQLALFLFVVAVLVTAWIRYSKLGYYMRALRDDQQAASSVGIDVPRYKMYGWIVSAALTGLAGGVYTAYIQHVDPAFMFSITQSVLYAVIPIIGGIGTIMGPVIGTVLMVPLQHLAVTEFGGRFGALTYVVYGIILILLIMYAPDGLLPRVREYGRRVERFAPEFSLSDDPANVPWKDANE